MFFVCEANQKIFVKNLTKLYLPRSRDEVFCQSAMIDVRIVVDRIYFTSARHDAGNAAPKWQSLLIKASLEGGVWVRAARGGGKGQIIQICPWKDIN